MNRLVFFILLNISELSVSLRYTYVKRVPINSTERALYLKTASRSSAKSVTYCVGLCLRKKQIGTIAYSKGSSKCYCDGEENGDREVDDPGDMTFLRKINSEKNAATFIPETTEENKGTGCTNGPPIDYAKSPELISYFTYNSGKTYRLNCKDFVGCYPEEHCPISRVNEHSAVWLGNNSCSRQDCFVPGEWYKGKRACTVSGRTCQHWVDNFPHVKIYEIYSPGTYEQHKNYCRQDIIGDLPWCYTTDPSVMWEYCDITVCPSCEGASCQRLAYNDWRPTQGNLTNQSIFSGSGEYIGEQNTTVNGSLCVNWKGHNEYSESDFPENDLTLARNYCRAPDREAHAWCYTTIHEDYGFCVTPKCYNMTS